MDRVLARLAVDTLPPGIALVAVGGYGRGELAPFSDIDLLFVTGRGATDEAAALKRFLYPLWDARFQVGHAVIAPRDAIDRAARDVHAATALLSARFVAGDRAPFAELCDRKARWLARDARRLARRIVDGRAERHRRVDRAGWSLAPDIKDDAGGLRDHHALIWLATLAGDDVGRGRDREAADVLTAAREALHGEVRRKSDRMHMGLQPAVARRLGLSGTDAADALMTRVHSAARIIEHDCGATIRELGGRLLAGPRRSGALREVADGIRVEDGVLTLTGDDVDHTSAVRLIAAIAHTGRDVSISTLAKMRAAFDGSPVTRWSDATRVAFLDALRGPDTPRALEMLDHTGGWRALLPEWEGIRGRAQHDPYHRYTVDAHCFYAVAEVTRVLRDHPVGARAAREAGDLDELYLAALLHDIGKGSGDDHCVSGERIARAACRRMGVESVAMEAIAALVRHHLLLADTATRRDIDDGAVVDAVAKTLGDARTLRLLLVLTIADGRATGPEAWTAWKDSLVTALYRKTVVALETGELPARGDVIAAAREVEAFDPGLAGRAEAILASLPPTYLSSASLPEMADEVRLLLQRPRAGDVCFRIDDATDSSHDVITVCALDRPGTLARTAGVLAVNRISVHRAQAYSTSDGYALERFTVARLSQTTRHKVGEDLRAAYAGRFAVEARVARKIADYAPQPPMVTDVRVLQDASEHSTVIEVRAPDALGLLFALASALSDLDLDIHLANIDTLGDRVVDAFYVRTLWGTKLHGQQAAEIRRAIEHRVTALFGRTS